MTAIAAGNGFGNGGGPCRVLVCDDERHIARLIQVNLERQGHHVVCAFDGRQAIKKLETESFDRVLLDVMMPYLDGFEVLRWIRTQEHTKHLWVAIMLAKQQDGDVFQDAVYRADKYVAKPFNPREILP